MSVDDIINEINNYKPFIQGITVSGGECTLQEDFLFHLFTKIKSLGLTCFIDSNGSKDFKEMPKLLEVCDSVMLDVKAFDNTIHNKYISFDNANVLSNLEFLASIGKLYEVRTVIVPELFNNEETVRKVSEIINKYDSNIRYKLIKFRNLGVRQSLKFHPTPSDEYMNTIKSIAEEGGCKNIIIV